MSLDLEQFVAAFSQAYATVAFFPLGFSLLKQGFKTGAPLIGLKELSPIIVAVIIGAIVGFAVLLGFGSEILGFHRAHQILATFTVGFILHIFAQRDAQSALRLNSFVFAATFALTALYYYTIPT